MEELNISEKDLVIRFAVNETISEWSISPDDSLNMEVVMQAIADCESEESLEELCEKYNIIFLDPVCMGDYESISYHVDEQISLFTNFALAMKNLK